MVTPWKKAKFTPAASSSPALKLLTIIALVLPPTLYLVSFSLTLATINTPDYVKASRLSEGTFETSGTPTGAVQHASLFFSCPATVGNDTDPDFFEEHCTRRAAVSAKGREACSKDFFDVTSICPKVVAAAELYVAAAVLAGAAFLAAALHALLTAVNPGGIGLGPTYISVAPATKTSADAGGAPADEAGGVEGTVARPSNREVLSCALSALSIILAITASGCLIMGQVLGVSALVIEASPSISEPLIGLSRWHMSRGAKDLTSAAYGVAIIGALVAITGCGTR